MTNNASNAVDAGSSALPKGTPEAVTSGAVETKIPKPNQPPPEKFDGNASNWKMWKKKMFFYLTTMNLQKYTSETKPVLPEGNTDPNVLATVNAWEHGDYLCKGFILNSLCDPLFRFYSEDAKFSKDLWEALDKKYRTEDSGTQKFVVSKFRQYQMVDSRPLMEQVSEVQTLLHESSAEGMQLCETYQGRCIIDMLPPG